MSGKRNMIVHGSSGILEGDTEEIVEEKRMKDRDGTENPEDSEDPEEAEAGEEEDKGLAQVRGLGKQPFRSRGSGSRLGETGAN